MSFEILFVGWLIVLVILMGVSIRFIAASRKAANNEKTNNKLLAFGMFAVCCFGALLIGGYREFFAFSPQIISIAGLDYSQGNKGVWRDPGSQLIINFDRPINANELQLELGPELQGSWEITPIEGFLPELLGFNRQAVYTPERTAFQGQELQLYLVGLKSIAQQGDAGDKLYEIELPSIDNSEVKLRAMAGGLNVSYPPGVREIYEFELLVTDSIGRVIPTIQSHQPGEVVFKIEDRLNSAGSIHSYRARLFGAEVSRNIASGKIVDRKPREQLQEVTLEQQAYSAVDFSGQVIWREIANYTALEDLPDKLEIVYGSTILATEDSFKARVIVEPKVNWKVEVVGQKLSLRFMEPLKFATSYNVVVLSGNSGVEAEVINFRTPKEKFMLQVPLYRQELQFECNLTAASMLLNYYGYQVSKEQIYQDIPKDTTPFDPDKGIWGDPETGFVGDITGRTKGYGVHWQPIMDYISRFRPVQLKRNWNIAEMLQTVKKGYPVMLWWQNGRSVRDVLKWQTPAGKQIEAVNGMHSEVVVGFEGGQESPQYILVNDPWRGFRRVHISEFTELWKLYSNTAIY